MIKASVSKRENYHFKQSVGYDRISNEMIKASQANVTTISLNNL